MSEVYWIDTEIMSPDNSVVQKLHSLVHESGGTDEVSEGMRVSLKINTAEEGYEYGLRPVFLRAVADAVHQAAKMSPILCDGVKLVDYWQRKKGTSFLDTARANGYTDQTLGGNFVINGGFSGDEGNTYPCGVPDSRLGGVEVGTAVCRTDALWVLSHVTFHPLFGLSGALLNGGFECLVGRERVRVLGGIDPYPFNGARAAAEGLRLFHRQALEGHAGVRTAMEGRVFYLSYLWDVTPQPEYFPFSAGPATPNLGFLASRDPVSLDAATQALIRQGLAGVRSIPDPVQDLTGVEFSDILAEAEALGLGTREYSLKRFS